MDNLRPLALRVARVMLLFYASAAAAQPTALTLDSCHALARRHYPLIHQFNLIGASEGFSLQNANKGYLPQVALAGHATYQSDVTSLPIAIEGQRIPALDKDQYRVSIEVTQSLTDIAHIGDGRALIKNQSRIASAQTEVELHRIAERINQLFFSILLFDTQEKQLTILREDILLGIKRTQVAVANGTALKSNLDLLHAELLNLEQRVIELNAHRAAYLRILGGFIGLEIAEEVILQTPVIDEPENAINRPELSLFMHRRTGYDIEQELLKNRVVPRLSWFAQAGYGKPGLNILNNGFDSYYIAGFRLAWNMSSLYTLRNDLKLLDYRKRSVDVEQEVFLFATDLSVRQQDADIEKFRKLISADHQLIELRDNIKNTTKSQLEHGVATTIDYLKHINDADEVRQRLAYHEMQLLMTLANKQITTGN